MNAELVEVADILGKDSAQVALVGGDDMIEQFAGTASQPAFSRTTDCARTWATAPFPRRGTVACTSNPYFVLLSKIKYLAPPPQTGTPPVLDA